MGPHYLSRLFNPRSIAVFGASEREHAVGTRVFHNLLEDHFQGKLYPVNPKHERIQGVPCYPNLAAVDQPIDLAIVATPADAVLDVVRQCGDREVGIALVLSAGFRETGAQGTRLEEELRETAAHYNLRLVGPNCLGLMRPRIGLNATFLDARCRTGRLALVSQSGAICTGILDWADPHHVGFSTVASLGNAADIDFGDVLDFLSMDPETDAILLYIEGIRNSRAFMSGLRAAARMKPVIVLKAGRHASGTKAAATHTGALIGSDDVFDAALGRAGAVRVNTVDDLFSAAEILASGARTRGNRLAIVTNGGGPGVLATDRASELGILMAEFSPSTLQAMDEALPKFWSRSNPVDILGDATPDRYAATVSASLKESGVDGVLVLLTPQSMTQPAAVAEAVVAAIREGPRKPVLTCWLGETGVAEGRRIFQEHQVPHFPSPEQAVEAFGYLARYKYSQELLLQTPAPLTDARAPDVDGARLIIESVLAEGRAMLSDAESKAVLRAFHIPTLTTIEASTASAALVAASTVGFPVAMKIVSPDITHKSDVGGVRLNIATAQDIRTTFKSLVEGVKRRRPQAEIKGVAVEHMHRSRSARELMVGVVRDPVFGPVIRFGSGGTSVEIMGDGAVALPPLNRLLVQRMIRRTRVSKLLDAFRNLPAVNGEALENVLLRVSEMVCELPHIQELDINPLMASESGVVTVDARVLVKRPASVPEPYAHMAIHPYPSELVTRTHLPDGTAITLRPIRPEDAKIEQAFVRQLSAEARYFRFMQTINELTPEMLVRFTQLDYDREMALIAVTEGGTEPEILGVARYTMNPDVNSAEFALVVTDQRRQQGIGSMLMEYLMEVARDRGVRLFEGEILRNNHHMLSLMRELGFSIRSSDYDAEIRVAERRL